MDSATEYQIPFDFVVNTTQSYSGGLQLGSFNATNSLQLVQAKKVLGAYSASLYSLDGIGKESQDRMIGFISPLGRHVTVNYDLEPSDDHPQMQSPKVVVREILDANSRYPQ